MNGSSTLTTRFSPFRTFKFPFFRNVQVAEQFSVLFYVSRAATVYQKFYVPTRRMYLASMKRETLFFSCYITLISLSVKKFVLSRFRRSSCFRLIFLFGALIRLLAFFITFVTHYGRHVCSAFTLSVAVFITLEAFHVFIETLSV